MFEKKTVQDFIYLISCSVNEEKPDKERCVGMDLPQIFQLARRQSLTAMAAFALEQAIQLPADFKEEKFKVIRRLSLFDIERSRVLKAFEENGIWYAPLKGIVMKEIYPKTFMREMGDNDILCDETMMQQVKELMTGLGFHCDHFGKSYHDVYHNASGTEFEIHRSLFDKNRRAELYFYFKNIKDRLVKDKDNRFGFHLTAEDMYLFLISHLYKHYSIGGTGLRSLLDIYVFNKRYGGVLNTAYINEQLSLLHLTDFEIAVKRLAERIFGLTELSEVEQGELDYFVDSNTYGTFDQIMMRQLNNNDSNNAKRKYVFRRIFPSEDNLKKYHPTVYRYRVLYPFLIVIRPVKGLLFRRNRMLREIKTLRTFKKKENRGMLNE